MRKKKIWWLLPPLLLGIFFAWKFWAKREPEATYQTVTVTRGDLRITVLANGVAQPQNRLEIKPPIAGRIESIFVEEGQAIRKGQVLAQMSSNERATLLDAARAKGSGELAYWEDLFKPTPLIAPLSGTLIVRAVEPGQVVTAQDPVLVMSDHLIVRVQVDETDIAQIRLGQPAQIRLEAYPQEKIVGQVNQISFESKVINNVTVYEVDVLPTQVPAFMRSGMTTEVEFAIQEKKNALLLPTTAVKKREGRSWVLVRDERTRKPVDRELQVGIQSAKQIEVLGGVREGQAVLIPEYSGAGKGRAAPNSPLNPIPRGRPGR